MYKPLALTFLELKVRYTNATVVTSPVKDTDESFSHAHDMGLGGERDIGKFIKSFIIILCIIVLRLMD